MSEKDVKLEAKFINIIASEVGEHARSEIDRVLEARQVALGEPATTYSRRKGKRPKPSLKATPAYDEWAPVGSKLNNGRPYQYSHNGLLPMKQVNAVPEVKPRLTSIANLPSILPKRTWDECKVKKEEPDDEVDFANRIHSPSSSQTVSSHSRLPVESLLRIKPEVDAIGAEALKNQTLAQLMSVLRYGNIEGRIEQRHPILPFPCGEVVSFVDRVAWLNSTEKKPPAVIRHRPPKRKRMPSVQPITCKKAASESSAHDDFPNGLLNGNPLIGRDQESRLKPNSQHDELLSPIHFSSAPPPPALSSPSLSSSSNLPAAPPIPSKAATWSNESSSNVPTIPLDRRPIIGIKISKHRTENGADRLEVSNLEDRVVINQDMKEEGADSDRLARKEPKKWRKDEVEKVRMSAKDKERRKDGTPLRMERSTHSTSNERDWRKEEGRAGCDPSTEKRIMDILRVAVDETTFLEQEMTSQFVRLLSPSSRKTKSRSSKEKDELLSPRSLRGPGLSESPDDPLYSPDSDRKRGRPRKYAPGEEPVVVRRTGRPRGRPRFTRLNGTSDDVMDESTVDKEVNRENETALRRKKKKRRHWRNEREDNDNSRDSSPVWNIRREKDRDEDEERYESEDGGKEKRGEGAEMGMPLLERVEGEETAITDAVAVPGSPQTSAIVNDNFMHFDPLSSPQMQATESSLLPVTRSPRASPPHDQSPSTSFETLNLRYPSDVASTSSPSDGLLILASQLAPSSPFPPPPPPAHTPADDVVTTRSTPANHTSPDRDPHVSSDAFMAVNNVDVSSTSGSHSVVIKEEPQVEERHEEVVVHVEHQLQSEQMIRSAHMAALMTQLCEISQLITPALLGQFSENVISFARSLIPSTSSDSMDAADATRASQPSRPMNPVPDPNLVDVLPPGPPPPTDFSSLVVDDLDGMFGLFGQGPPPPLPRAAPTSPLTTSNIHLAPSPSHRHEPDESEWDPRPSCSFVVRPGEGAWQLGEGQEIGVSSSGHRDWTSDQVMDPDATMQMPDALERDIAEAAREVESRERQRAESRTEEVPRPTAPLPFSLDDVVADEEEEEGLGEMRRDSSPRRDADRERERSWSRSSAGSDGVGSVFTSGSEYDDVIQERRNSFQMGGNNAVGTGYAPHRAAFDSLYLDADGGPVIDYASDPEGSDASDFDGEDDIDVVSIDDERAEDGERDEAEREMAMTSSPRRRRTSSGHSGRRIRHFRHNGAGSRMDNDDVTPETSDMEEGADEEAEEGDEVVEEMHDIRDPFQLNVPPPQPVVMNGSSLYMNDRAAFYDSRAVWNGYDLGGGRRRSMDCIQSRVHLVHDNLSQGGSGLAMTSSRGAEPRFQEREPDAAVDPRIFMSSTLAAHLPSLPLAGSQP